MKLLFLTLLPLAMHVCAAPKFGPGKETSIPWKGLPNPIRVYIPEDYQDKQTWPCVFYYHGTNALPRTDVVRRQVSGKRFIIVGMEYHVRGELKMSKADWSPRQTRQVKTFRAVRDWLSEHVKIDPNRVYVGGASKGGWATTAIGDMAMKELAGLIILMGGRHWSQPPVKHKAAFRGKSIFIGVGERDLNNISSHWAREYYHKLGAKTCMEEYPGLAHNVTFKTELLRDWLHVQAGSTKADEIGKWAEQQLSAIEGAQSEEQRYFLLNLLRRNPKVGHCSKEIRGQFSKLWKDCTREGTVGEVEWKAEKEYRKIVMKERAWWRDANRGPAKISVLQGYLADGRAVIKQYRSIIRKYPETYYARVAKLSLDRFEPPIKHFGKRLKSAK